MRFVLLLANIFFALTVLGQQPLSGSNIETHPSPSHIASNPPPDPSISPIRIHQLSDFEFWLCIALLVFGLVVIFAHFTLMRHLRTTAEDSLRVYGVTLILVGTLFAMTAHFDSNQLAPVMGLFGTMAGYLLGKRQKSDSVLETHEKEKLQK